MPSDAPPADQFWLLTDPVPSGPFTVGEIHAKLATGDVSWQTPACPVGGAKWLPLVQTPGIGPGSGGAEQSAEPAVSAPAEPAPLPSEPSFSTNKGAAGAQPQSTESRTPRNDAAPRSAKQVAEAVGGIAALLLVGGLIWGAKCAEEAIRSPKAPALPPVSQTMVDPAVVARFANKETTGKAGAADAQRPAASAT